MSAENFYYDKNNLWLFGYGSLMWQPDFFYEQRVRATLHGYHRQFCLFSHVYRGTPEMPGLVLGLAPGGRCDGIAYRIAAADAAAVFDQVWQREMITAIYIPHLLPVTLFDAESVTALVFVADTSSAQYAGALSLPERAAIIKTAQGCRGTNYAYFQNTIIHLQEMGIEDAELTSILSHIGIT